MKYIISLLSTIEKRWLFVISIYAIPFFLAELTICGYTTRSVLYNVGLYSAIIALFLWYFGNFINTIVDLKRTKTAKMLESNLKKWLIFHEVFRKVEIISIIIAFLVWIIGSQYEVSIAFRGYYFIWFLLCSCLAFPYFNIVRNLVGMQISALSYDSVVGARAFASIASRLLAEKIERGVKYLVIALKMLKGEFKSRRLAHDKIDKTLETIFIIRQVRRNNLPYKALNFLSNSIVHASSLENIPNILQNFLTKREIAFTKNFKKIKKSPISLEKFLAILSSVGILLGIIIQLLPEKTKEFIINCISQNLSSQNIITLVSVITAIVLSAIFLHFVNNALTKSVSLDDIK